MRCRIVLLIHEYSLCYARKVVGTYGGKCWKREWTNWRKETVDNVGSNVQERYLANRCYVVPSKLNMIYHNLNPRFEKYYPDPGRYHKLLF